MKPAHWIVIGVAGALVLIAFAVWGTRAPRDREVDATVIDRLDPVRPVRDATELANAAAAPARTDARRDGEVAPAKPSAPKRVDPRFGTLVGRVLGPDGSPVSDARVSLVIEHGLRPVVEPGVVGVRSGAVERTDTIGAFSFDDLGSDRGSTFARVRVVAPSCADYESETVEVPNGARVGPIVCRLRSGIEVVGTVTSRGVAVRATVRVEGGATRTSTDEFGRFRLADVDVDARLCAFVDAHPSVRACTALTRAVDGVSRTDVRLDHVLERFTGTVRTDEGHPLEQVEVRVECPTDDEERPSVYRVRTDSRGQYDLDVPVAVDAPEREWVVRLDRWKEDCEVVSARPPAVVDLVCAPAGRILLSVVDTRTALVVPTTQLDILWRVTGKESLLCRDRADVIDGRIGVFVPPGPGKLFVQHGEHTRELEAFAAAGETIELGTIALGARRE